MDKIDKVVNSLLEAEDDKCLYIDLLRAITEIPEDFDSVEKGFGDTVEAIVDVANEIAKATGKDQCRKVASNLQVAFEQEDVEDFAEALDWLAETAIDAVAPQDNMSVPRSTAIPYIKKVLDKVSNNPCPDED